MTACMGCCMGIMCCRLAETSVEVTKDGRPAGAKSYTCIYRTVKSYEKAIALYEYQKYKKADYPEEFLKGFQGLCATDGYWA